MLRIEQILNFWFGIPESSSYGKSRKIWFVKDPNFDRDISDRFLSNYEAAVAGHYNGWTASPDGCLALILLFDQFPRHIFRGDRRAYATDAQALITAQQVIAQDFDQALLPVQRMFIYLPFEHSENLEHQRLSVELFRELSDDPDAGDMFPYAVRHKEIIERFGRFPHRNQILGRTTTPEEAEFLKQPGSSF
ncbi:MULTISPECIES: DUF924 family protein [Trichocoleus]|uniref:DUF924 domain-containing protein n=1 Tax=Trichocoleus desertorum GB2-A4 TaxID=2933944 RepID=A0ABV0J7Y8_9CYAN|nr:DUF924 family protein [Trichocoleus sp. FACHB-46]MBD1863340.1 DUF924 domain-containing protein [Trichocoleus sp. FACHB-46]